MGKKEVDLTGLKFFKLTILKKLRRVRRATFEYECICECGQIVITQTRGAKPYVKCCKNCRPKIVSWRKGIFNEKVDKFSTLRHRYKKGATDRNLTFNLSREQFEDLIIKPCYYCGSCCESKQMYNKREMVYYTGIDRVDNSIGYEINNCVPCCKICNILKKAVTKQIIEKAYKFLFGENNEH